MKKTFLVAYSYNKHVLVYAENIDAAAEVYKQSLVEDRYDSFEAGEKISFDIVEWKPATFKIAFKLAGELSRE